MPICLCLNWCSTARISSFFVQLPTITDTSSPWLPYLAAVYNEPSLPLPINLQQLGLVALPSSRRGVAQAGIPFETECAEPHQQCPCESALWLNESAVPLGTAALPQLSAQHNRSQRALPWSWRPGGRTAREKRETVTDVRLLTPWPTACRSTSCSFLLSSRCTAPSAGDKSSGRSPLQTARG